MSLQKLPPTLPAESSERSTLVDVSYSRRVLGYAVQQTREHQKLEMIAGTVAGLLVSWLSGGLTLGSVALGLLAFLATFGFIFFYHLIRTPRALDQIKGREIEKLQGEVEGLNRQIAELSKALPDKEETIAVFQKTIEALRAHWDNSKVEASRAKREYEIQISKLETQKKSLDHQLEKLKNQLAERDKHKLTFEIHPWSIENVVFLIHNIQTFAPPEIKPIRQNHYVLKAGFKVRFVNSDPVATRIREMRASLIRMIKGKEQQEEEIKLLSPSYLTADQEGGVGNIALNEMLVQSLEVTDYFNIHINMQLRKEDGEALDDKCFLRLTMTSLRQHIPFYVDLSANWEEARQNDYAVMLTPKK